MYCKCTMNECCEKLTESWRRENVIYVAYHPSPSSAYIGGIHPFNFIKETAPSINWVNNTHADINSYIHAPTFGSTSICKLRMIVILKVHQL